VQGMDGLVLTRFVQPLGDPGRQRFVDEQPHEDWSQGFPPGLPRMGTARA
jgi:hypothetical protein